MAVSLLGRAVLKHLMTPSHLLRLSRTNLSIVLVVVGQFLCVCTAYPHDTGIQSDKYAQHSYSPTGRDTPRANLLSNANALTLLLRNFSVCASLHKT